MLILIASFPSLAIEPKLMNKLQFIFFQEQGLSFSGHIVHCLSTFGLASPSRPHTKCLSSLPTSTQGLALPHISYVTCSNSTSHRLVPASFNEIGRGFSTKTFQRLALKFESVNSRVLLPSSLFAVPTPSYLAMSSAPMGHNSPHTS